jgi:hypothetical protein
MLKELEEGVKNLTIQSIFPKHDIYVELRKGN